MVDLFLPEFLLKNSKSFENKKETNTCSVNSHTHESYDAHICHHSAKCDICRVTKQNIMPDDVEFLFSTHQKIKDSGLFNFQGCRLFAVASPAWQLGGVELQGRALVANPANAQNLFVLAHLMLAR